MTLNTQARLGHLWKSAQTRTAPHRATSGRQEQKKQGSSLLSKNSGTEKCREEAEAEEDGQLPSAGKDDVQVVEVGPTAMQQKSEQTQKLEVSMPEFQDSLGM